MTQKCKCKSNTPLMVAFGQSTFNHSNRKETKTLNDLSIKCVPNLQETELLRSATLPGPKSTEMFPHELLHGNENDPVSFLFNKSDTLSFSLMMYLSFHPGILLKKWCPTK